MNRNVLLLATLTVMGLSLTLSGCKWAKEKIGIKETVSNPDAGTPEKLVYDVVQAGILSRQGKVDEGWELYSKYLHPDEKRPARLRSWRENNFKSLYNKVHLFTTADDTKETVKDSSPEYEIVRRDESDDGTRLKVYVFNEGNEESPTPCKMEKTDDGWRIRDTCL